MSDGRRFGCECGADSPCLIPMSAPSDEYQAWWKRHPARAGIKPLSVEAAMRGGGYRHDEVDTGADSEPPLILRDGA